VLRRAFRNHRPGLALTAVVAIVAIATLVATAVVNQRGDRGSANEPQAEEPPPSLGIDLIHCPKAEPEELPPYALAGATEAALDQVPSVFGHVIAYVEGEALTSEGAYAGSAYLTEGGRAWRPGIIQDTCRERPQQIKLLLDRSVEVNMLFPEVC
jgi:hypothetical protein